MTKKVAGIVYLKVDGQQYALRGNCVVKPSNVSREGVAGQDGVHGYKERPEVPSIKADISDMAGLSIKALDGMRDVTVTVELETGKQFVARNAWTLGAHELNTSEGTIPVTWEAVEIREVAIG